MYTFNFRRVDVKGNVGEKVVHTIENHVQRFSNDNDLSDYICNKLCCYVDGWEACGRIYKKSIIDEYNIRFVDNRSDFAEDLCFTLDYMLHVKAIFKLCDMLYFYRITPGSLVNNVSLDTMLIKLYNLSEHFYEQCKLYNKTLVKDFKNFFSNLIGFHIRYKLNNLSKEEIDVQLDYLRGTKYAKKWSDIGIRGNDFD